MTTKKIATESEKAARAAAKKAKRIASIIRKISRLGFELADAIDPVKTTRPPRRPASPEIHERVRKILLRNGLIPK